MGINKAQQKVRAMRSDEISGSSGGRTQRSDFYYVISKLLEVVLPHTLILAWKLCPD
jgi:hypothetical protein